MKKSFRGKIITHNVILEQQEYSLVLFLLEHGENIELIPPSLTPNSKTPDFIMQGIVWEAKSPQGNRLITIERALHRGVRQSCNIVLDLRRMQIDETQLKNFLDKQFLLFRSLRKLKAIFKSGRIVDYHK